MRSDSAGHRDFRPGGFQVQLCEHHCLPTGGRGRRESTGDAGSDGAVPAYWTRHTQ